MMKPKLRKFTCEICGERVDRAHRPDKRFMANFPLDEERCREWVKAVGNEDLVYVPIEKLHTMKYVCGSHFKSKDFNKKGNRLTRSAVPSLNLYAEPLPDSVLQEFPCHIASYKPKNDESDIPYDSDTDLTSSAQGLHNSAAAPQTMIVRSYDSETKLGSVGQNLHNTKIKPQTGIVVRSYDSNTHLKRSYNSSTHLKRSYDSRYLSGTVLKPSDQTIHKIASLPQTGVVVESNDSEPNMQVIFDDFDDTVFEEVELRNEPLEKPKPPPKVIVKRKRPLSTPNDTVKKNRSPNKREAKKKKPANKEPSTEKMKHLCANNTEKAVKTNKPLQPSKNKLPSVLDQITTRKDLNEHDYSAEMVELGPFTEENIVLVPDIKKPLQKEKVPKKLSLIQRKKIYLQLRNLKSLALKMLYKAHEINNGRKPLRKYLNSSEEVLASALHKKSPQMFSLLQNIQLDPGISPTMIEHLEKQCATVSKKGKLCALLFHDVALTKRLIFDPTTDKVEGFVDLGEDLYRTSDIANRALVFVLQGLHQKIEQPIAYYLVKGSIPIETLALLILQVIKAVHSIGYTIVTTVCDQRVKNIASLNLLKEWCSIPRASNFFIVDDIKIFIIFDVPHLFNSLRNNFCNAGEIIVDENTGKWSHLIEVVKKNKSTLHFKKITATHLKPRLKVKYSAQILSNTVAAILKLMAEGVRDEIKSREFLETAQVIETFDQLFDCMNGPASDKDIVRQRREIVSKKTNHLELWKYYSQKITTICIPRTDNSMKSKNKRCIKGFLTTLSSLEHIWNYVESKGFLCLNLRQLNLDCWKNLFEMIHRLCPSISQPTCYHFKTAFKSHMVTRLIADNQVVNCQGDSEIIVVNEDILKNEDQEKLSPENLFEVSSAVQNILKGNTAVLDITENEVDLQLPDNYYNLFCDNDTEYLEVENSLFEFETQPTIYVTGYLASAVLKKLPWQCVSCKRSIAIEDPEVCDPIICEYKELCQWWPNKESLTYPTLNLCQLVDTLTSSFEAQIKSILHEKHVSMQAVTMMLANCDNLFWICEEHRCNLLHIFLVKLSHFLIRKECHSINLSSAVSEEVNADATIHE